ncbi:MAG: hypothetical protein ABDK92_10420 [Atribacterota bacterium]
MRFLKLPYQTFIHLVEVSKKTRCQAVLPVYLALLYHADSSGYCFPGYQKIMEHSGVRGKGSVNRYFLTTSTVSVEGSTVSVEGSTVSVEGSTVSVEGFYTHWSTPLQ